MRNFDLTSAKYEQPIALRTPILLPTPSICGTYQKPVRINSIGDKKLDLHRAVV
jgi:hypothetical protein